jgi:hypothetical protein
MRWLFLIPLTTAAVTAYISQKSDDEITYLTSSVTVISLILSLILAPWELQVFVLILALLIVRQLWNQLESKNENELENPQSDNQNGPDNVDSSELSLSTLTREKKSEPKEKIVRTYRGIPWRKKIVQQKSEKKSKSQLRYRGNKADS